ncbi:MSCRAMM family protein [Brotaphodocola sp.]|uniref:MSCRAMM family protein n=1 Tax=Brotaphodocola sp. TaxID=3073577 RepID=UPI003D7C5C42
MKKPEREDEEKFNLWKSAVNTAETLIFLLIFLATLLGLYLLNDYTNYHKKETIISRKYEENQIDHGKQDRVRKAIGGEDQVEEQNAEATEKKTMTTQAVPGENQEIEMDGVDDKRKSAVLAQIVDAETGKTIPVEGAVFELYKDDGTRQILNAYYPDKVSYREFVTTDKGNFYLPEKIFQGDYKFHEKTTPEGYERSEDKKFRVGTPSDWTEPYLVDIPLSPSKDRICVQICDRESGKSVSGGHFVVLAEEDIQTLDGTIRYRKGERVGEIICDATGYGESEELYLGTYSLHEKEIPRYYAGIEKKPEIVTEKKDEQKPEVHEIEMEKTKINLKLVDERYPQMTIEGAKFQIVIDSNGSTSDSNSVNSAKMVKVVKTDETGSAVLTDLEKNTTYRIRQMKAPGDYYLDPMEYELTVDEWGRIDGDAQVTLSLTNRMLRVTVRAVDAILKRGSSGVRFSLYDADKHLIDAWSEDGNGRMFTELSAGTYYLEREGRFSKQYELTVRDEVGVQEWKISTITWKGVLALVGAVLAVTGLVLVGKFGRKNRHFRS